MHEELDLSIVICYLLCVRHNVFAARRHPVDTSPILPFGVG